MYETSTCRSIWTGTNFDGLIDDEHFRALEEQWIDSMDSTGSVILSQSASTNSAMLQGTMIGFFFPILPFFFMKNPKPAVFWEDDSENDTTSNVVFSWVDLWTCQKFCSYFQASYADGLGNWIPCKRALWHVAASARHRMKIKHLLRNMIRLVLSTSTHILFDIINNTSASPWVRIVVLIEVSDCATACQPGYCCAGSA